MTSMASVLIFDEVKTGVTIAPGGATEMFGVQPDLVCLAKAIGGGTPVGAFGGKASVMDEIEHGVAALGTFNGNPLSMAAGLATLTEVLTPDAYEHLATLGTRLAQGCQKALDAAGIAALTTDLGCKESITFRDRPLERYRDYQDIDDSIFDPFWYWMINRDVYQTPARKSSGRFRSSTPKRHRPLRQRLRRLLPRGNPLTPTICCPLSYI